MQAALRPWITAGLAVAGAGVIATIPMAASMHHTQSADIQLVASDSGGDATGPSTNPLDGWEALFTDTGDNLKALSTQIPDLLKVGAPAGAPDADVLLKHAFDYPLHNLGAIVQDQLKLLQDDLSGSSADPTKFITDLLNAPAVELNAVLNGTGLEAADGGLRGLLNPINIPTGEDGDTISQLGTFSNIFAVIGDQIADHGGTDAAGLDFGF